MALAWQALGNGHQLRRQAPAAALLGSLATARKGEGQGGASARRKREAAPDGKAGAARASAWPPTSRWRAASFLCLWSTAPKQEGWCGELQWRDEKEVRRGWMWWRGRGRAGGSDERCGWFFFIFSKKKFRGSTYSLPCAREMTHGKGPFCRRLYAVSVLACLTHGSRVILDLYGMPLAHSKACDS